MDIPNYLPHLYLRSEICTRCLAPVDLWRNKRRSRWFSVPVEWKYGPGQCRCGYKEYHRTLGKFTVLLFMRTKGNSAQLAKCSAHLEQQYSLIVKIKFSRARTVLPIRKVDKEGLRASNSRDMWRAKLITVTGKKGRATPTGPPKEVELWHRQLNSLL